jgi:prepilin-type N-terminal cleavage/methylation domain-containing protein
MKLFRYPSLNQKGFTLIELGVTLSVLSAVLIATTVTLSMYYKRMHVQLVGQQYQAINSALGKYMQQYFPQLITLHPNCSVISMAVDRPLTIPEEITKGACKLNLNKPFNPSVVVSVANGFQPTIDDLRKLDLLAGMTGTQLQLQTTNVVKETTATGDAPAGPRFVVQISKVCNPSSCTSGSALSSLVFNSQPFTMSGDLTRFNFDLEEELLIAGGADAVIASLGMPATGSSYELKGDLYSTKNPIRLYRRGDSIGLGVRGIMALRNSYATTLDSDFARRDGTSIMTGDWEFSDKNVSDINILSAEYIDATERVTTNKLYAQHYKLPSRPPFNECDASIETLSVDAGDGEIYICRRFDDYLPKGWWKPVVSRSND